MTTRSPLVRALLVVAGTLSLALGVIGIFLPLLPTTPFLLLSAACYARSSQRFYDMLMSHRVLGPFIRDYREGRGVPMRTKTVAIAMLWLTLGSSILFWVPLWWVKLLLAGIGIAVTVHLVRLPTR